jgi:hypothetical protein
MGQILSALLGLTALGVIQFRIGRWLARRAPGREMAACAAYQLLNVLLWTAVGSLVLWRSGAEWAKFVETFHPQPGSNQTGPLTNALYCLACWGGIFYGGIRARRRHLSA